MSQWTEHGPGVSALAAEIRRRLGPPADLPAWPLVSIVVLNRDGADHLRHLLAGLVERTDYPDLELILVDNASDDDSLDFIRAVEAPFPISILANPHNESFSDGCNQGAELASGELLLFLNNDIEPFEPGWLRELVACLARSGAGAVGATLIEPDRAVEPFGFAVHQRGLIGRRGDGMPTTGFRDHGADPLDKGLGEDVEVPAVAAASLLIARPDFDAVGGFTHGYWYGPEDVDIALKLRADGKRIVCSGRTVLIHHTSSTLSTIASSVRASWARADRRLFWGRWGPRLRREYELDRLQGGGTWVEPEPAGEAVASAGGAGGDRTGVRAEVEELGFCLKGGDPCARVDEAAARELLDALCQALCRRGRRCLALWGAEVDDLHGLTYDIAVHLRGPARFVLAPAQLNVLWCAGDHDLPSAIECSHYDLVLTESQQLDPQQLNRFAASLIVAVGARAAEIGFRTRIDSTRIQ
jgi:GT2 family glycosyltransferase